jgi:hypothetical protein
VLPNHQNTLKMETELVAETSENLHILMRLSVREIFIVVNFSKTHVSGNWCCYEHNLKCTIVEGTAELLEVLVLT